MTPVLEKPYISVSINPENIIFWHFTNGGHTRKLIMAAPMFLRIKRSISVNKSYLWWYEHFSRDKWSLIKEKTTVHRPTKPEFYTCFDKGNIAGLIGLSPLIHKYQWVFLFVIFVSFILISLYFVILPYLYWLYFLVFCKIHIWQKYKK